MFKTGILSNIDIEHLMGKEIFIYPYKSNNAKGGSTYNLTASCFAYYIDNNEKIYAVENNKIKIPPHTTVLIQTEESIYVTNRICGSYHSKVSLVSKGLGHIGTTLDPMYFGTSKIAIQNTTDKEQTINVGQTFVSLMFYRTVSKANSRHDNGPGRQDVVAVDIDELQNVDHKPISEESKSKLKDWSEREYYRNMYSLMDLVIEQKNRSTLGQREKKADTIKFWLSLFLSIIPILFMFMYWILKPEWITKILLNESYVSIIIAICPLIWLIIKLIIDFYKSHLN